MYEVLQDFKGSPDGAITIQYKKGDRINIPDSLAKIALNEKWIRNIAKEKDKEGKTK